MKSIVIDTSDALAYRVIEDGTPTEERSAPEPHKGDIYFGIVTEVSGRNRGASVDIGRSEPGFLPTDQVLPAYGARRGPRARIEDLLEVGQNVLVQVSEVVRGRLELTTMLTLASRYLVIMPGNRSRAVSKKIVNEEERTRLLTLMARLGLPADMGYVLRTSAADQGQRELKDEVVYLLGLWRQLVEGARKVETPQRVYVAVEWVLEEIADEVGSTVSELQVDDAVAYRQIEFWLRHRYGEDHGVLLCGAPGAAAA